jgi:mRNA interferase RelE/StbE
MYDVILSKRAQRLYNKLSGRDFERIDNNLELLKTNPRPQGVKKITGNIYRIREGDWRIIYAIYDKGRLVIVGKIGRRSEDTYDGVKEMF